MTVNVLSSEGELTSCAKVWQKWQKHPYVDWEIFNFDNRSLNGIENPFVLELKNDGEIKSLWAGRIERVRLPLHLGYLRFKSVNVKRLTILPGGVMGDDSEEACRILLRHAVRLLDEKQIDVLSFSNIRCDHPLYRLAAHELPRWYCRDWGIVPAKHWKMELPVSYEELLKRRSQKHRYWLKRLPRVLEETFPGQISFRVFHDVTGVDEFCRDARTIQIRTYQQKLGIGFRGDAVDAAKYRLYADRGGFRGYVLYVKSEPRAFWLATTYQDTLYLNMAAYDPEMRRYELGTILLMRLLADHCGTVIRQADFGHGEFGYKERLSTESFFEASVRVYSGRPRAALANVITGCSAKATGVAKVLLRHAGALHRIKALWRRKLAG